MFKIKRPAIIGLLLVLLVFTGYLNYELTQEALKKTSGGYKKHELAEKTKYEEKSTLADKNSKEKIEFEIVDSEVPEEPKDSVEKAEASEEEVEEIELEEQEVEDEEEKKIKDEKEVGEVKEVVNTSKDKVDKEISKEASSQNRNYYIEYKLSRDKLRASLVDRLDTIVSNEKTDEKTRSEAQREIMTIGKISEKELQIEGLIKSKGFEDSLVVLTEEDVKVIISASELTEQDMVKILDIVKEETKFDIDNIKIIKKQ